MKKKSSGYFDRFANKSNAARKEEFKQEKRKWKAESRKSLPAGQAGKVESRKSEVEGRRISRSTDEKRLSTHDSRLTTDNSTMPLNKYIAHSGVCSRRDAAELVKQGQVRVNNEVVTEPGHKVSAKDEVLLKGKKLTPAKNLIYILLNKPKDYLTTTDDPQKRKTVLDLIRTKERIYPIGRLDRNTSGVLLLTNDGELSQKLSHPSHEVRKVYHVTLNRPLEKKDFDQVMEGVVLEDGVATVDALAYPDAKDKAQLGVEIHSGRNRIVRRIFEHLGYQVKNLDRVVFAGLTKKNVERGKWRFLSQNEVRNLKYLS